jgi:hypothetical protein
LNQNEKRMKALEKLTRRNGIMRGKSRGKNQCSGS